MSERVHVRPYRQRRESQVRVPHILDEELRAAERALFMEEALEFAQKRQTQTGLSVAFTGVFDDNTRAFVVGLTFQDRPGYSPVYLTGADDKIVSWSRFDSYDAASAFADQLNEELGLSKFEAIKIVTSSMRAR